MNVTRREFQQQMVGSLLTWSLLDSLFRTNAFAGEIRPIAAAWLAEINQWSEDLKGMKLEQAQWQTKVEELFSKVELTEMLKFIDFEALVKQAKPPEQGEQSMHAVLPKVDGLPTELVFGHQVFALAKNRSVVPHGHDNMATAFLILDGTFQGRHYDRLEDDKEHMIITPTIDRAFKASDYSTVTDYKDNVHWFTATSDRAFIFNIHVMSVRPGKTGRIYIDPNGEKLSGGRIKAKKLNHTEVYKLYG